METTVDRSMARKRKEREYRLRSYYKHRSKILAKAKLRPRRSYPLRAVWRAMKARCLNPNHKSYPDYGGRGITISREWLVFENFQRDMSPTYASGLYLDRRNNNRGYCAENCRWVTARVNHANRRTPNFHKSCLSVLDICNATRCLALTARRKKAQMQTCQEATCGKIMDVTREHHRLGDRIFCSPDCVQTYIEQSRKFAAATNPFHEPMRPPPRRVTNGG